MVSGRLIMRADTPLNRKRAGTSGPQTVFITQRTLPLR